jgi:hypothetical protein
MDNTESKPFTERHKNAEFFTRKPTKKNSPKKAKSFPQDSVIPSFKTYRKSKSISSISSVRNSSKILFSDFWSNRMKAEVRYLERKILPETINLNSCRASQGKSGFLPKIHKNNEKVWKMYSIACFNKKKIIKDVPEIEKIIDQCNVVRKGARRLSFELSTLSRIATEESQKLSRF